MPRAEEHRHDQAQQRQAPGRTLTGIDVPTLRDVWATAPYLHDGSAPTLAAAVQAHQGNTVAGTDLDQPGGLLAADRLAGDHGARAVAPPPGPGTGTGLTAAYFNNRAASPAQPCSRGWRCRRSTGASARPAAGVPADNFSVRWSGEVQAVEAGNYQFRTTPTTACGCG
jgi:hypothetical protein